MARGFDSKSVSDQQEEAQRRKDRAARPGSASSVRRRSLELARLDLVKRMQQAPERMQESMRAALSALDVQIAEEEASGPAEAPRPSRGPEGADQT